VDIRVDARRQAVWRGEECWSFDVDCRDAIARIDIGEERFEVRALSWREKRNLARFAHLGEEFLERQFSRLCCRGASSSDAGAGRDVLLALAMWVNDPGPESMLPLNTEILSRVLVDLCRSTGLGPGAFDDRPAHEVEALWRTIQDHAADSWGSRPRQPGGASMAAVQSEVTRIVVTPDSEGPGQVHSETTGPVESAALHPMPQTDDISPPPAVPGDASAGGDDAIEGGNAAPSAPTVAAASQAPPLVEPRRHARRAAEPRFRVLFPVAAGSRAGRSESAVSQGTAVAPATPARRHEGRVPAMRQPASQPESLPPLLPAELPPSQMAVASLQAPLSVTRSAAFTAGPPAHTDVLDDLASRLEEAAEELGIDIHS
jgi:hypothetical protein